MFRKNKRSNEGSPFFPVTGWTQTVFKETEKGKGEFVQEKISERSKLQLDTKSITVDKMLQSGVTLNPSKVKNLIDAQELSPEVAEQVLYNKVKEEEKK